MPTIYVIGGPNGAGKSTTAMQVLPVELSCAEFVNADSIAAGLSPFNPDAAAMEAGRIMLRRIGTLIDQRRDFGFETTMAARSHAKRLQACRDQGFAIQVLYFWLNSPELAIKRVEARVRAGGHHIPDAIVRRRYAAGLRNFFRLYQQCADSWIAYDNSGPIPKEIARKSRHDAILITDEMLWNRIRDTGHE